MNWKNKFNREIVKRGKSYYDNSLIRDFKVEGLNVSAKVIGSEIYHVEINKKDGEFQFSCDCPHFRSGYNCKHLVAVLMTLDEYQLGNSDAEIFFNPDADKVLSSSELRGLHTEINKFFAMYSYKARYNENSENSENLETITHFIETTVSMLSEDSIEPGLLIGYLLLSKLSNLIVNDLVKDKKIASALKLMLITLYNKDPDHDNFSNELVNFYLNLPEENINEFVLDFLTLLDLQGIEQFLNCLSTSFEENSYEIKDYQIDFYFEALIEYMPTKIDLFLNLILVIKPFDISDYLEIIFLKIANDDNKIMMIKNLEKNIPLNNRSKAKLNSELVRIYLKNNEIDKLKNHYQVQFKKELNPQLIKDFVKLFPNDEEATYNIVRSELLKKEISDDVISIYLELELHQDLINRVYNDEEVFFIINYQKELIEIAKNEYFDYCLQYLSQYPSNKNNRNAIEFTEQLYKILKVNDESQQHIRIINRNWLNQAHRFPELAKIVLKYQK